MLSGLSPQVWFSLPDHGCLSVRDSIDRNNSVVRDEAHRPQQVSFSRDQNYHPYVEINGKFDLWFTVWFRAPVAPCFFELRLEDGSKHSLQVPFISSTGIGLEPRE